MPGTGKVTQVIGSTFDVEFPEDQLPQIYNAVQINETSNGQTIKQTNCTATQISVRIFAEDGDDRLLLDRAVGYSERVEERWKQVIEKRLKPARKSR